MEESKYIRITGIIWDTDGEDIDTLPEEVDIPIEVLCLDENDTIEEAIRHSHIYDNILDYLSDTYGFLVGALTMKLEKGL